jgi:WD40 repeat protein
MTGVWFRTMIGHEGSIESVSCDQLGLLASGSSDSTIKLWNVTIVECIRTLTDHNDAVESTCQWTLE